ncbi:hypothetical protein K439DRAFT_1190192 [Ramaria rubella]|nr:hypothetical protein K439DRAFT_1190192 [Ramaria rubella]
MPQGIVLSSALVLVLDSGNRMRVKRQRNFCVHETFPTSVHAANSPKSFLKNVKYSKFNPNKKISRSNATPTLR